jgi:hypothetical protein
MSSFINLMADDVWSETDMIRRTEAMIRSEFSLELETILNRKVSGMALGTYQPTGQDLADIARYDEVARDAQAAGVAARADMALLLQVFPLEEAQRRLDRPVLPAAWERLQLPEVEPVLDDVTGEVTNGAEVEQDRAERDAAGAVIAPHLVADPEAVPEEGEGEDAPMILDPEAVVADEAERSEAQAIIDAAPEAVASLFELRKTR